MIFRRLMIVPRFYFSEAAQTIEGICNNIKDISLQLLRIHLQEDMQDLYLLPLLKPMFFRLLLPI